MAHSDASITRLRFAELLIFGFPAAFFLMLQQRVTLDAGSRSFLPPPLPFWLLLIFTYGMFIPNTWRRGALVIGAMAVAPIVLLVGMVLAIPKVAESMTITGVIAARARAHHRGRGVGSRHALDQHTTAGSARSEATRAVPPPQDAWRRRYGRRLPG